MNRWKMNNLRRLPLAAVLAIALVLTAALSTIFTGSNPSQFSSGILEASYAESTALHCSGLLQVWSPFLIRLQILTKFQLPG